MDQLLIASAKVIRTVVKAIGCVALTPEKCILVLHGPGELESQNCLFFIFLFLFFTLER